MAPLWQQQQQQKNRPDFAAAAAAAAARNSTRIAFKIDLAVVSLARRLNRRRRRRTHQQHPPYIELSQLVSAGSGRRFAGNSQNCLQAFARDSFFDSFLQAKSV